MRKTVIAGLVVAMVALGIPSATFAEAAKSKVTPKAAQTGTVTGTAQNAQGQALAKHTVRIRNTNPAPGQSSLAGQVTTDAAGTFTGTVPPGSYVVEIVDAAGNVVATSTPLTVAAGTVATVTVTASAAAAAAAAVTGGGFSLFGLGTAATLAVLGGAGVATIAGITVATKDDDPTATPRGTASPSR